MNRILFAPLFVGLLTLAVAALAAERPKPNVVLLLTDDLGWQDVGCYDIDEPTPFETPNLDQMAKDGVMFWQGYSPAPTCAPTRVAILSGKHPARSQKTHVVGGAPPTPYSKRMPIISPWYSGRMPTSEITIAEALKTNGYVTGTVGKWHCAISHHAFPMPKDQGFDFARMNLGETRKMKNRLKDFATNDAKDPYRLDENGFPRHENSEDALAFLKQSKDRPFFLYYATWLVHTPIHTRHKALLEKYCKKMNLPFPTDPTGWKHEGQKNPYYGAMVETLDYHVGRMMAYLKKTDDPRWPGHKLVENTYVIFTSDNGGMERVPGEQITDNYPLDKGKINAKEGGVRVPLLITGPGIAAGKQSHAMVNGLDFYPTILKWTGTPKPKSQHLDGADLSDFLKAGAADPDLILDTNGKPRNEMTWHFPNSVAMQSTIRVGNFKLIRNWLHRYRGTKPALELYRLYDDATGTKRVDIEERNNLAIKMPEKAKAMDTLLEKHLQSMKASPPYLNPNLPPKSSPKQELVCEVVDHGRTGNQVWLQYKENGAKVVQAHLIWTDNGGHRYEEWYRLDAKLAGNQRIEATLPKGTTHYVWNLIDENHFLVSHPQMRLGNDKNKENYSKRALVAK